ncbi:hypothetical protein RND81_05G038900 [Saponaria officinalis]|uniref:Legumain prodomain domain-containing protein n=1 Tax=Saponaria officinalis TaxID=3572 RepID=A0AAW1KTY3_SAPOF
MFTDDAVYKIIKKLFGDKMVGLLMTRPNLFIPRDPDDSDMPCLDRVSEIFVQHCGLVSSYYCLKFINIFEAMCIVGVDEQEFKLAASETCKGNVYVSQLGLEKA